RNARYRRRSGSPSAPAAWSRRRRDRPGPTGRRKPAPPARPEAAARREEWPAVPTKGLPASSLRPPAGGRYVSQLHSQMFGHGEKVLVAPARQDQHDIAPLAHVLGHLAY